ncbi:hypothetical protein AOLI_G00193210 [Acnodon oligacanthus]
MVLEEDKDVMNYTTTEDDLNPALIRKTIFHVTAVCGGLPAVVWALHVLYHHHRSGGQISAISIFLLLSDLLELILSSVMLPFILFGEFAGDRRPPPVCARLQGEFLASESPRTLRYE